MRIVYMLSSLGIGGAERQAIALAQGMAVRGHATSLLVLRPAISEQWPTSLDVVHLNMRRTPVGIVAGLLRARSFVGDFQPDMIHSHTYPANMAARMLRLIGAAPTTISTIHNVYEGGKIRTLAYRLTDGLSDHSTAVSNVVAAAAIRVGSHSPKKCSVITNGIDTVEFSPDAGRRAAMRLQLRAADDFIWLAAGRIVPAKDYPNLLRAFALALSTSPQMQLWIAGEGSPSEKRGIETLIRDFGLSGRVHCLGLRRDMPAVYDAADAFVLSSAWEGMPLALGEAMAMEKSTVATDVGGVRELAGDTGAVVPAKDSSALSSAMLAISRSPLETRHAQGHAARQRIKQSFSIDSKIDQWEALYSFLLNH